MGNLSAGQFLGFYAQTFALTMVSSSGSNAIGGMFKDVGKLGREILRATAHGTFNGTMRMAQGGKFEHGFLSGFVSSLGGSAMQSYGGNMTFTEKTAIAAVIGGTADPDSYREGGGKFANGAVTGAFVMAFNHLMHEWHPSRQAAAASAQAKTSETGNETSVLVFQDDQGELCYWECPHDEKNSTTESYWVFPPEYEMYGLTLTEEFHYSVKDGLPDKSGRPTWIKGSFQDWRIASKLGITVTHTTIGIGSWFFRSSLFFEQPQTIIHRNWIYKNNIYPIVPPKWYTPFKN